MSLLESDNFLPYEKLSSRLDVASKTVGKPLTLAEKVVYSHLDDPTEKVRKGQGRLPGNVDICIYWFENRDV